MQENSSLQNEYFGEPIFKKEGKVNIVVGSDGKLSTEIHFEFSDEDAEKLLKALKNNP